MFHNLQNFFPRWTSLWMRLLILLSASLASLHAAPSAVLQWDASVDSFVTGYRVKYGTTAGNYTQTMDVGNVTTATVANLAVGTAYFFVVTAYDITAVESAPSVEVSFTPINRPPTVSLTGPVNGSSTVAPANLTLMATASDLDGSIVRVEFYQGATKLGQVTTAPYTYSWSSVAAGTYNVFARAFDDKGASTDSAVITVSVTPPPVTSGSSVATVNYINGGAQITVTSNVGVTNSVYASSDMASWNLLSTAVNATGTQILNDQASISFSQRFYRVSSAAGISDAAGFIKLPIRGVTASLAPSFSYLGITLLNAVSYRGTIGTWGNQTITDPLASWTGNPFTGTNGEFYLEITSGTHAGVMADIIATDAAGKTLTLDENLSSLLAGGETFTIRKHRTLGDVFGENDEAGLIGGATISSADEVRLFNPVTQTFLTYFFKTGGFGGIGWRSTADSVADAAKTKLYPDQGLVIRRKMGGSSYLVVKGTVKTGPTVLPVGPATNLLANVYPAGLLTLENAGLWTGSEATGLAGGASVSAADEVRIFDGTAFRTYFYKTGGFGGTGWRNTSNAVTDAGGTAIAQGTSILIVRKSGHAPFLWTMPQPF